jgi:hypothetical protein
VHDRATLEKESSRLLSMLQYLLCLAVKGLIDAGQNPLGMLQEDKPASDETGDSIEVTDSPFSAASTLLSVSEAVVGEATLEDGPLLDFDFFGFLPFFRLSPVLPSMSLLELEGGLEVDW